ncbi:MAG: hypothetical protein HQ541_02095 [Mariniphaga sp.]|nr:hypothetical protein [Mariniphaga sp.]
MKEDKILLDFEREFNPTNIPFGDIIDSEPKFKNELFNQFCNAESKPNFDLYLADFYSQDEINKGFKEASEQIPVSNSKGVVVAANFVTTTPFERSIKKHHQEFTDKIVHGTLPIKYYCPDIEKTTIVQTLKAINKELDILKESVFDEKTDKYKEAEIRAYNVIKLVVSLGEFAQYIINYLQQDKDNILLHIKKANKSKHDFWKTLKSNFNNSISNSLPQQTTEQMKENLLQLVCCSKGNEIIDEIDKIYLDKSLSIDRKIVLIGDIKDIFKLGEKNIKDGVVSIFFDEKEYIFPEWKIKSIVDCCKDRLKKLKRRQREKALPPQQNNPNSLKRSEHLSDIITDEKSKEIVEAIKVKYKNIKGKRLRILLMALQELEFLPKNRIAAKFHACCKNDFDWEIASYNAMDKKYFKIGFKTKKGDYIESDDEKELKQIISYINSVINS